MRTKTLLLTAALCAAGVATSMAQVYSVNAVGYVNLSLPAGFSLIANPLNNGDNKVTTVLPTAPDGTTLYKFIGNSFDPNAPSYIDGFGWFGTGVENYKINPGEGFFIFLPSATTLTFVGEVPQGTLTTAIPVGFSIVASQVPQAGKLQTDLKFTPAADDTVYKFIRTTQNYDPAAPQFIEGFGWFAAEPTVEVGESFFLLRAGTAGSWTRTFNVN